MREFNIPAIIANKVILKDETLKMMQGACFSIKQGQRRFLDSYRMALADNVPGWNQPPENPRWKTDPHFAETLRELEDTLKTIFLANGLTLPTWNRYKGAARRVVFGGIEKFSLAIQNFSLAELRVIQEKGERAASEIRKQRHVQGAINMVQKHTNSVVIPLPILGEQPHDYVDAVAPRLAALIEQVRSTLGEQAANELLEQL